MKTPDNRVGYILECLLRQHTVPCLYKLLHQNPGCDSVERTCLALIPTNSKIQFGRQFEIVWWIREQKILTIGVAEFE